MARSVIMVALCLLPAVVMAARPNRHPFVVRGRVYCDTCRAGFETSASTYIPGATVRLECKHRRTMDLVYSHEARTDSTGTYKIWVDEDHEDQFCDVMLMKSTQPGCSKVSPGRGRARVTLSRSNAIASDIRVANSMGFVRDEALSGCSEIMKQYQEIED